MNKNWAMIRQMEVYGGSFVRALAGCLTHADGHNYVKLLDAFPEYCDDYAKRAEKFGAPKGTGESSTAEVVPVPAGHRVTRVYRAGDK